MPAGAKRKRTAKNGGSAPKRSKKANAELREWQIQYYQGVSALELSGLGCGSYLLGSPDLNFHSPLEGLMWLEIMSGMEGPGTGGMRLCAVSEDPNDILSPTFIVPFQHVGQYYHRLFQNSTILDWPTFNLPGHFAEEPRAEQFIILDDAGLENSAASKEHAYRAIIVPTAAVGASPLQRTYSKAISFNFPEQKAGKDLKGLIGEANDDPNETHCSLITRVINEQLAPYQKTVIDASMAAGVCEKASEAQIRCDAVLRCEETKEAMQDVQGQLFFLKTGILFHSQTTVLYLTAKSTQEAMLIHNFEGFRSAESTNVSLICRTSEPYYEGDRETAPEKIEQKRDQEPLFISFCGIDREMSSSIAQHAKRYGIGLSELEQEWYSLEEDQPMSGWMPRSDRD